MADQAGPFKVMIRATAEIPAAVVSAGGAAPAAVPERWQLPRISRRAGTLAACAAVAAAAAAGALWSGGAGEAGPAAAAKPPVADGSVRLRRLDVGARLPAGWREASDGELGAQARNGASVVFRGAALANLDAGVFLAASAPLAPGDDLIAAARTAERGVIRQLGLGDGAYHPAGCGLIELGGRTAGQCRGTAAQAGSAMAVAIYVRSIGDRGIIALSLAAPAQDGAAAEAAAVIASLTPLRR